MEMLLVLRLLFCTTLLHEYIKAGKVSVTRHYYFALTAIDRIIYIMENERAEKTFILGFQIIEAGLTFTMEAPDDALNYSESD